MAVRFANYASTTLAAAVNSSSQTSLALADASPLPALNPGDWFYLTLIDQPSFAQGTNPPAQREVVKVTAVAGNTLTVERGVDGTVGQIWPAGSIAELRFNAAAATDLIGSISLPLAVSSGGTGAITQQAAINALTNAAGASVGQLLKRNAAGDVVFAAPQWFNATDYGCVGDGATDNTAAIGTALSAVSAAGGGVLFFPAGTYRTNGGHSVPANVTVRGANEYATIFGATSATADIFTLIASACCVCYVGFTNTVARTAGSYVVISGGQFGRVHDVKFNGAFIGVSITGASLPSVNDLWNLQFTNTVSIGIDVHFGVALKIHDVVMQQATGATTGLRIVACADLEIRDTHILQHQTAIKISPATGQSVFSTYFNTVFADNSTGNGIVLQPAAGASIYRTTFTNVWSSSNGASGFSINSDNTGTCKGVQLIGCHVLGNNGFGAFIGDAQNVEVIGGEFAANTNDGIVFNHANTTGAVVGATIGAASDMAGNGGVGINIASASTDAVRIVGNDLRSNTAGAFISSSSGPNLVIHGNIGYNDFRAGTKGSTSMNGGFTFIPAAAGTPTGTPTALPGFVPLYYDTANNKLYAYSTTWKQVTLA